VAVSARRAATGLLALALAGLGLAAAVDAVVGGDEQGRRAVPAATTVPLLARQPELAVAQLREAGVTGVLTFSDDDCRLHALSLPELRPRRAPRIRICEPLTGNAGLGVVDGEVVWAGLGLGVVQTVLSKEALSGAIRAGLGIPDAAAGADFRAVQAVALGPERYAVLADSTYVPRERVVAGFFRGRRVFVQPRWRVGEAGAIRPSPGGRYFALLETEGPGVRVFARGGRPLELPRVMRGSHAVAWSPDDRWTALATEDSVYVYPTERPEELVIRIRSPSGISTGAPRIPPWATSR
jgi:hypothetical protein